MLDKWGFGCVELKEGPGARGLFWISDVESVMSGAGMDVWEVGSEVVEPLLLVKDRAEGTPGLVTPLPTRRPGSGSLPLCTLTSPSCCSSFTS